MSQPIDHASIAEDESPSVPTPPPSQSQAAPADVLRIQELLAAGDVDGAEAMLKALRKQMKRAKEKSSDDGERKKEHKKEKDKSLKNTDTVDGADSSSVLIADELKARHSIEKEHRRETEKLEKLVKEAEKKAQERSKERIRDEKKEKDRIDRERRELDKRESDARREWVKEEKKLRDELDAQRKEFDKQCKEKIREQRKHAEACAHAANVTKSSPAVSAQKGMRSLTSFGFSAEKRKNDTSEDGAPLLFSKFVQDKRIVPPRLQFWNLMRPELNEIAIHDTVDEPLPGGLRTSRAVPEGFNNEVVYCSFHAVGFEPAQARPSYFGTSNPTLNETELFVLARFTADSDMPRLSTMNYDYDSGDDWDHMENDDDDVDATDDEESEDDSDSNCSADSFIDDGDCGDSEGEQVNSAVTSRVRRQNRLRGKDKLVPSYSGPFVDIAVFQHPLRNHDCFEVLADCNPAAYDAMLLQCLEKCDLATAVLGDLSDKQRATQRYRAIGDEEIAKLRSFVLEHPNSRSSDIVEAMQRSADFGGISSAEIHRGLKRLFARPQQGRGKLWTLRDTPLAADDPQLFEKKEKKDKTAKHKTPSVIPGEATCIAGDLPVVSGVEVPFDELRKRPRDEADVDQQNNDGEFTADLTAT